MTPSYFANPLIFIIETLFFLYMMVVALRLLMPWIHWPSHAPLSQFVIRATQPAIKPMRQFMPAIGRLDSAVLLLLILLALCKLFFITALQGVVPNLFMLLLLALADLCSLFVTLFTISIIVEVILSWVTPAGSYHPMMSLISRLNAPLLDPVRQRLPDMGGLDLAPLLVIVLLQAFNMFIVGLISELSRSLI
ncbi:Integral membrane protein YggT, involved in response to extracytoplasmic stress (osmotic shock) [Methylophaga frappieri]|uniref:Integral membrane protein YggT, involved in response to extracytoplasmic stress (Osmotic shock) n=1 Tax=Methylophaga frappieri (strain ATCC BAA-2434 / DSM 25690 / JAM7) TaxID=754477 RepID=I1YIN6_METFJ|nr:YggT family protein [Methylophaga frappieri]AFJ02779.1 Integral membrane protein YggT, involved in response to extracytoplasmic stress (osmotic shock) [Methylophaga frappieri]